MTNYIGIDIGGSNTRIGLFLTLDAPNFAVLAKFPTSQSYAHQLAAIDTALRTASLASLAGIGISIAGRLAKDGQSIIVAPNLPEYVNQPFAHDNEL